MPFYVVQYGKVLSVYNTWDECEEQVVGYRDVSVNKFVNYGSVEIFIKGVNTNSKSSSTRTRPSKKSSKTFVKDPNTLYIFTDGSSIRNGSKTSKAGYGIYIPEPEIHKVKIHGNLPKGSTNNYAELFAILNALKLHDYTTLLANNKYIKHIVIVTDSEYSMNCITKWCSNWVKKNWKSSSGKDVKNKELIQKIYILYKKYKVKFKHINSHTSNTGFFYDGNRVVDKLASGELD